MAFGKRIWFPETSYGFYPVFNDVFGCEGHVMVMMVEAGIPLDAVTSELAKRHVIDHKVKQERLGGEED